MRKIVSAALLLLMFSLSLTSCRAKKVDCPAYGKVEQPAKVRQS